MLKSKNRIFTVIFAVFILFTFTLTGCSSKPADTKVVKVGATAVPHAEILEFVKPKLAEKGIDLQIQVFNDYVQPNLATDEGSLDANYFQHIPYLDSFNAERNLNLVVITKVHIEPMGIYSKKVSAVNDFPQGSTIAIPNDPTNGGRALIVLESAGLIKLKADAGIEATVQDIVENTKELNIITIDAAQLPRVLDDPKTAGAVINTNYALEADLNPTKDALFVESKDSPYSNILVAKAERADDPILKQVAEALNTEDVKKFIEEKYQGAVVPAF